MFGNPKLYIKLLKTVVSCKTPDQLEVAEAWLKKQHNIAFNLTDFEYRALRKSVEEVRHRLGMDKTELEKSFWESR